MTAEHRSDYPSGTPRYRYDVKAVLQALEDAADGPLTPARVLAEMAGVSRRTIVRWRVGDALSVHAHRIADRVEQVTGVPIWLLEREAA